MNEQSPAGEAHNQSNIRRIQSPTELGVESYEMGSDEHLIIGDIGVRGVSSETRQLVSGETVDGCPSLQIRIGGYDEYATLEILDVSGNKKEDFKDDATGETHYGVTRGYAGDKPIEATSNYVLVISDADGVPKQIYDILPNPDEPIVIGRHEDAIGGSALPDVVSRRHLTIGIQADGTLEIVNEQPTNTTQILRPEVQPAQDNWEQKLIYAPKFSLDVNEVVPLSDEQETADIIGLAGQVVAELMCNAGTIEGQTVATQRNMLVVQRKLNDGTVAYSLVQELRDGKSVIQTPVAADKPILIKDKGNYGQDVPISLSISDKGELALDVEGGPLPDAIGTRLRYATVASEQYVKRAPLDDTASAGVGVESPSPHKPDDRRKKDKQVVDARTGKIETFNPYDKRHFEPHMQYNR